MGSLRFRRRIRIAPGVWLNVNKRSVGVSAGVRGARASINTDGQRTTSVGVPGTGLYYRWQQGPVPGPPQATFGTFMAGVVIVLLVVGAILALAH
jgi:hypothetical protein